MTAKLFLEAIIKFIFGFVLLFVLIFLPAGTLNFLYGWLFMGVLFIPMLIAGIILMIKNPDLLKKRLDAKEKQREQKTVVALSGLMFVLGFTIAGLDFRFSWLPLPSFVPPVFAALFLFAYALYAEVMRENIYLSRTIDVEEGQKVIDKGLYSIVRHPMYSSTVLLFLSIPFVLGSLISLIVFIAYPFILAKRIKSEEKALEEKLVGYTEYKKKVKYKLIPFIW